MKLTVLGKYGPYPAPGGACSGYLAENGRDKIVMDMGSGTLSRLLSLTDIRDVTAIFISHLHYDHTGDLLPLCYLLEELEHTVTVYTAYEDSDWYRLLFTHPNLNIINIDENSKIRLADTVLTFRMLSHTATDYAVILKGEKTLCYTGDTRPCAAVEACCRDCDYLLADCSKPEGDTAPHMTVADARRLAQLYGCKLIATHQSAAYNPVDDLAPFGITSAEEMKAYLL